MKKILLIVILLISSASTLISQREFSNWYFGQQSGITFNTPTSEPVFLPGNPSSQFEGVATISDANGQVLLSANGEYVFNRSGKVLNIGHPMMGHYSSTQAVIIVPKPGSKNLYYVFTSDAGEYTGEKNRGINYSIVDIDANDGEGAFVEINQNLLGLASEQLTAVYHPNRRDIWIVARGWKNNNFYAFLLTADGLSEPVITSIGFTRTSDNHTIGCLKFSPNGSFAAAPVYNEEFIELFKFDKNTGEFYDRLQINLPDMINLYGVEFSPNGEMLYVTNSRDALGYGSLLQLDVSNYNKSAIENSIQIIYQNNIHLGTIQIGPNRKIYLAILNSKFLMCVLKPDLRGDESGFNLGLVALNDSLSQLGLPQFTGFWSEDKELMICEEEDLILDPDDFLHDTIYIDIDYEWTGPNGFTSKSPIAIKENIQLADSGDYVLSAVYKYQDTQVVTSKMIKVRVGKKFKFSISGKDSICTGEFTLLEPDTVDNRFQYRWNTGHNSSSLVVRSTGLYKLYISNSYGCTDSAEFFVNVIDKPHAKIEGEKLICLNSSVELKSEETDPELKYLWSTGDTTQSITVDTSGIYELTVSNGLGCFSTDEFEVYYYPDMALEIIGDTVWCSFTPAKLTASVTPYHDSLHYDFVWSNGVTGKDITVNKTGELSVIVTVEGRCVFYDTIFVIKSTPPRLEVDITEQRTFCDNETLVVDLIDPEPEVNYYWEDTELPEFPRIISETGKYKIMALTKEGCKDEFEFEVEFLETPEAQILFSDTVNFCNLDSLTLEAYPKGEGYNYLWLNNGKREEYLTVYESGVYSLVVTNELGCSDTAYIEVNLGAGLPVRISGRVNACIGDSITLTARVGIVENLDDFNFLWSNGETTNSISVNTGGSYNVIVEHSSGCIGYDTVKVNFFEVPKLEFDFDRTVIICEDEEFEAKPKEINPAYLYSWSDGTFNVPKTFRESGVYTLYAMNAGQCTDSIEFELIVRNSPLANIVQDSPLKLCPGDSLFIGVETDSEDNNILWSNGETNDNISVDKPGVYHVTVTSPDACVSTDSIIIEWANTPNLTLSLSEPYICEGSEIIIHAYGEYNEILWQDGSKNDSLIVKNPGYYVAEVISEDGCSLLDSIYVSNFSNIIQVIVEDIDFGIICPSETLTQSTTITNQSSFDIEILHIVLTDEENFIIDTELTGLKIKAGTSEDIDVSFLPKGKSVYSAKVKVYYKHYCQDSIEFSLKGESNFSSEISLPIVSILAGDEACLEVNYKFECIDEVDFSSGFNLRLKFDASYFLPEFSNIGTIIRNEVIGEMRHLEISVENPIHFSEMEGILLRICGKALLGYDTTTVLYLEDFSWGEGLKVKLRNGTIINEACAINLRQFKYFRQTALDISPNPVKELMNINVVSEEKGTFVLELVNSAGISVLRQEWHRNESDEIEKYFGFDISNLSSGVYMLKLTSPWYVRSTKVIVIK